MNNPVICFLHPYKHGGGPDVWLNALINTLVDEGFTVIVVCPTDSEQSRFKMASKVIACQYMQTIPKSFNPFRLGMYVVKSLFATLSILVSLYRDDVAIVNSNTLLLPWGGFLALILNARHVIHIHGLGFARYGMFSHILLKTTELATHKYIAVSNSVKQKYLDCGGNKDMIEVIYNGLSPIVLTDHFVDSSVTDDVVVIGMVATIDERKGHDVFLKAIQEIISCINQPLKVYLVGGIADPNQQNYQYLAKIREFIYINQLTEIVTLTGHLAREQALSLLSKFSVCVIPSRTESFSFVAIECGLLKVPVVATRIEGLTETVEDNKTGILVPPNNPNLIAKAVCDLLNSESIRVEMGEAGYARARAKFSLTESTSLTVRCYRDLLT